MDIKKHLEDKELEQLKSTKNQIENLEYIEPFWSSKPLYDYS